MKNRNSVILVELLFTMELVLLGAGWNTDVRAAGEEKKPAVLFSCPNENRYEFVGYDYMKSLVNEGVEVDYVEFAAELTWERIKNYNVVVIMDFPYAKGTLEKSDIGSWFPNVPPYLDDYFAVLDRFLKAGGGVFLHYNPYFYVRAPNHLLKPWGIQFPISYIKDTAVQSMTNLENGGLCAFTDKVSPSPVSNGVRQIWYPIEKHYCGAHTMPILVDKDWQVVVRAGKTAWTEVPVYGRGDIQPDKDAIIPAEPIKDPVLFAIRDFQEAGRVAAVQTWHQFSIGSGMKWLYNNEILSRGLGGRPSDYGKLLVNTYKWLAEPSLKSGKLGGYVTDPARVTELQLRPGALEAFKAWTYKEAEVLEYFRPPTAGKIFRGLIGAQTALSGGTGDVADYAKVAVNAGLDFVVFLEDFAKLTPERLATLKAEVAKNSSDTLKLFAGYRMKCNTGNYLFNFGKDPSWPEDRVLTGSDKKIFNLQYQDADGKWAVGNPALNWCVYDSGYGNIGYYNFSKSGNGLRMYDLRVYTSAAIRTYEEGKLVEDMTDEYLATIQSTAVPTPISLNLVRSPDEMRQAVTMNQALTYAQARSLGTIFEDALRWNSAYDGMNVFLSDGPIIHSWPKNARTLIFGAESFVSAACLSVSPIHVTSEAGLKEIRIFDGQELFRRFICNGAKEFQTTLYIPSVVYRNMALIAEDVKGGVATSFAHRGYKEGAIAPVFCADHCNDGGWMLLAHGPHWPMFFMTPATPNAGLTWDGGPTAKKPLLFNQFTYPGMFTTPKERFDEIPYQVPFLEFADEGATRCRMVSNRVLAEGIPLSDPWTAFGPLDPSPLCDVWASHTYYDQYVTGVDPNTYGAPGVLEGPLPSLFTEQFTFKKQVTLNRLRLFHSYVRNPSDARSILMAIGKGSQILNALDVSKLPENVQPMLLNSGEWVALYSAQLSNTHLFINRGSPVIIEVHPSGENWLQIYTDFQDKAVNSGETYDAEFFAMTWPMNQKFEDARTIADVVAYLEKPDGLNLLRGKQGPKTGGLFELVPDNYAVELSIPKLERFPVTVPVRVSGFNKRWSVGLYQIKGYRTHYYSKSDSGWRALGLDFDGRAYVPLYVNMAPMTHVMIGHPVVADAAGKDLFIQVTRINDGVDGKPPVWHLSVNNPGNTPVTATLKRAMELPGLIFSEEKLTLQPGEYRVLTNLKSVEAPASGERIASN
ncbi:MAG: hypothetical protein HY350_00225 [Candidatus Omnitrophica bacterium]|nr:hypothetical protein [Candidatus Omnitrophota bacterium]